MYASLAPAQMLPFSIRQAHNALSPVPRLHRISSAAGDAATRPGLRLTESAEATIERCDRALHQAKRSGRNQTVTENDLKDEVAAA